MARALSGISARFSGRGQVVIAAVFLLGLSFLLTAYSSKHPEVARSGSRIISEVVTPLSAGLTSVRDASRSAWHRYVYLRGVVAENESLKREIDRAHGELGVVGELRRENERLRGLLNFSRSANVQGVTASVIGVDATGWVRGIVVNRGSEDGVSAGMAVVHPHGIVGQVVSAAQHSARVLLITDASSSVDALVQEGRVRGIAEGAGSQGCELRYVTKDAVIKSGELVVTSGFDRVYPKGVVLGVVSHVHAGEAGLFQSVRVKPAVDFSRLEEVMILPSETSMLAVQPGGALP